MRELPLAGIRVLDLTNVLAGPYCSYQLGLMGAEVIKVEKPGEGDLARHLGPDAALNEQGIGTSFLAQNAGKKSLELDLKSPGGRSAFEDLVRGADVLLENYRAGVLRRLGYDWDVLRDLNDQLIYCAITGFGQHGPDSQAPAYDQVIQGLSGMMSITGTAETAPLRIGFPVSDSVGGLMAAFAISSALAGRAAGRGGAFLDVSMLEASLSAMGWAVSNYLISGVETQPMGDQNATAAPSGTFHAADGPLNIAANRQSQFETLCRIVERPDLVHDGRFASRELRKANRSALNAALDAALARRDAASWEKELSGAGVPAARILTVAAAVQSPQLAHREFFHDVPFPPGAVPAGRSVRTSSNGVHLDGRALHPTSAPPALGEHNAELDRLRGRA
ncbi:CaiB/BaiF CoA transferase family protein [Kineosporia succinea]|uniref:Crotonobetainyl-CoA:carnitine CoA-transferase CaiB-like acyl-CoA transferase n=1 Tax=Kineosporia succinea TaxID=84632 RepID=A0ABT9PCM0_9ACTN|nr:CoA transferase [Kineosporia succinea]MDP9829715.1 crotonobetainyl-CoA:carnitine CoA-transferase CaiB-like acyl-CoA transferase [Kineosporia succinea]